MFSYNISLKTEISWYIMMDMDEIGCLHSSLSDFETLNSVFYFANMWYTAYCASSDFHVQSACYYEISI